MIEAKYCHNFPTVSGWLQCINSKQYMYICVYTYIVYTLCLRKICAKLFLSELRQISIHFGCFWWVDEKMAEIVCNIYIFHLTSLMSSQYLVKHKVLNFKVSQEKL